MFKKILKLSKWLIIIAAFLVLAGFAGVVGERFLMPWLSGFDSLQKYSFFKKANEQVTIINKTEQVSVKEDYSVAKTAEKTLPSVVSIVSFEKDEAYTEGGTFKSKIKSSQDIQRNIKTGLILTGDGLIVSVMDDVTRENIEKTQATNYEKSENELENLSVFEYKILAKNGKEYDAEIKAVDPYSNLIFYKIKEDNLSVPSLGNSKNLETGEKLVICGNAGGEYQNTFSTGILQERDKTFTLLNSELSSSEKMEGALMVNAEIDYRNIGGPVVDFNGNVVGIANEVEKDGSKKGFVMPIDQVKSIMNEIIRKEEIKRPTLGAYYLSINREIALLNNLPVNKGALIYSFSGQQGLAVIKDSPADKAGIVIGDIITKVENTEIDLNNPLAKVISSYNPGDKIEMEILRDGENIKKEVELE
jgi:S1-C subfamily serine protease